MTPQGLSKIIKNMENELDCTLIDRSPQGIRLTESGECLLRRSFSVTTEFGSLKKELLNIRQRNHGIVDLLSSVAEIVVRELGLTNTDEQTTYVRF